MTRFAFHIFGDENAANPTDIETVDLGSTKAAKSKAVRLAAKHGAPVDLSLAGYGPDSPGWADAYIGTASPAPRHIYTAGARFSASELRS